MAEIFDQVRRNANSAHQTAKHFYDLGTTTKMFKVGDSVKIKLKSIGKKQNKLDPLWSEPMTVKAVRGVVLELQDPKTPTHTVYIHADKVLPLKLNIRQ